jgi:hypothetical protein
VTAVLRVMSGWALAVALLAACGADDVVQAPARSPGASLALTIRYDDGAGRVRSGRLTCSAAGQRATGALAGRAPAARLCRQARAIKPLLTQPRPTRRACTQIYGGPQTLRVAGTFDRHAVRRRFTRRNGCEIADFDRVARALPITG